MEKTIKWACCITLIIILIILVYPRRFNVRDGGSYGYEAFLYKITFHAPSRYLYPELEHKTTLFVFPIFNFEWTRN